MIIPYQISPKDGESAAGGNGVTFVVAEDDGRWRAKIDDHLRTRPRDPQDEDYFYARWRSLSERVAMGQRDPDLLKVAAWPLAIREFMYDGEKVIGFIMRNVAPAQPLEAFADPGQRAQHFPGAGDRASVIVARHYAAAVATLHARGLVLRDMNTLNALVAPDLSVTIIDTDSITLPSEPEFLRRDLVFGAWRAPELQVVDEQSVLATQNHDLFALAQNLYAILTGAQHGFDAILRDARKAPPVSRWIKDCAFPFSQQKPLNLEVAPPRGCVPFAKLPRAIRILFEEAFGPDGKRQRPAASAWVAAFDRWLKRGVAVLPRAGKPFATTPPKVKPAPAPRPAPPRKVRGRDPLPWRDRLADLLQFCSRLITWGAAVTGAVTLLAIVTLVGLNAWRMAGPDASADAAEIETMVDVDALRALAAAGGPMAVTAQARLDRLDGRAWDAALAAGTLRALYAYHKAWPGGRHDQRDHYEARWAQFLTRNAVRFLGADKVVYAEAAIHPLPDAATPVLHRLSPGAPLPTLGTFEYQGMKWTIVAPSVWEAAGDAVWPWGFIAGDAVQIPPTNAYAATPLPLSPEFKDKRFFLFRRDGRARVTFDVDPDGQPVIQAIAECPHRYGYGKAAAQEIQRHVWIPATLDGAPIAQRLTIDFVWGRPQCQL